MQLVRLRPCACAAALVLSAPLVRADIIEYHAGPGLNLDMPDNTYQSGSIGFAGMGSHTILVDEPVDASIDDLNITIGLRHFWIGDLTMKLRAPDGTTLTLLNRPGHPDQFFGTSSDFAFQFPITYDDEAASGWSAEDMGGPGCSTVGSGSGACGSVFLPAPEGLEGTSLAGFDSHLINGEWTLYIGDSASSQAFATLDQWTLTFDATRIPAPGTMLMLAIGFLGSRRRAKRKYSGAI